MNDIKISIITVCLNARELLQNTILSVQKQDYQNIEYIIQDGSSVDGTLNMIEEKTKFFNKSVMLFTEKDQGIYDAMNKAAAKATGDYILFLNAGDTFANCEVIKNVVWKIRQHSNGDVFFGDIILVEKGGKELRRKFSHICGNKLYFLSGDAICHQAIIARKICVQNYPFLLEYKVCADREWMLRLFAEKKKFVCIDTLICKCNMEGFSSSNQSLYEKEVKRCIKRYLAYGYPVYLLIEICKKNEKLRNCLRKLGRFFFWETGGKKI